jgi:predicted Mrr-cat superfamily restriction endonuclease
MLPNVPATDYSTLNIEDLDLKFVSETQIVEFISRSEISLSRLVNEILQCMGYQTRVSPFGNNGSVDIVADGKMGPFDFALPRIAVLVTMDTVLANPELAELEAFMALSGASNGLLVSWTGFTELAQKEAGRLFHQAKFWDIRRVVEMLRDNYEKLSGDLQSDLRLEKRWVLSR